MPVSVSVSVSVSANYALALINQGGAGEGQIIHKVKFLRFLYRELSLISVLRSTRAYASALINQSGAGECRLHLLSILPHSKRMSYLPIAFLCAFLWSAQCPFWLQTRANTERSGVSIFFDDISVFWTMYGFVSAMYGFVSAVSC